MELTLKKTVKFEAGNGKVKNAPTFNYESSIYPVIDIGWKMYKWFDYDVEKLRNWYFQLEDKFKNEKFHVTEIIDNPDTDYCCHYAKGACFYDLTDDMIFGYLKEIKDTFLSKFSQLDAWTAVTHSPGTRLGMHQDEEEWLTVHIPVYTNEKATWVIGNEEFYMPLGNAYIINSTIPHNVVNYGDTDRVHIYFCIPIKEIHLL
jgi:hypothetical protein